MRTPEELRRGLTAVMASMASTLAFAVATAGAVHSWGDPEGHAILFASAAFASMLAALAAAEVAFD